MSLMYTNNDQQLIVEQLILKGNEIIAGPIKLNEFTEDAEADAYLNNLEDYSHAYVLACVMDRQIKAKRAWMIPYRIAMTIGHLDFESHLQLSHERLRELFNDGKLHRFNDIMSDVYFHALQTIHTDYGGKASRIWESSPGSATVVRRFLRFKGVGIKIATMATNILVRELKIPLSDFISIDVSPDVHVKRVFRRLGLVAANVSNDEVIYAARELNPHYPGIFDVSCYDIGRLWCRPTNPKCADCFLCDLCPKIY